jgi:hypothetical protein
MSTDRGLNRGPFKVSLAQLDWANPACVYAFPTAGACDRFALRAKIRRPHRTITTYDAQRGSRVVELSNPVPTKS